MKKLIVVMLASVMALSFTGCNDASGTVTTPALTVTPTTPTLTVSPTTPVPTEQITTNSSNTQQTKSDMESLRSDDDSYEGSIGPLLYSGSIASSITVYQYNIETGSKHEVFHFNNDKKYSTTIGLDINAIPCYQLKEIFSDDMNKMAVQWFNATDSSRRVGWIDKNGVLTDITELIHPTTSDFSSIVPKDYSPIFTPDGQFMFVDGNAEKYIFVNVKTQELIRKEDIIHYKDTWKIDQTISEVLFLPNGKMVEVIDIRGGNDYAYRDFGEYMVDFRKINCTSGVAGFDLIGDSVVVGIGRVNGKTSIGKYGEGVTEANKYGNYDDGDWTAPVFDKLTPQTDYRLESCAHNSGQIVFIGTRGDDRGLFIINDGSGEQVVKKITEIPHDEKLLFWR